MLGLLARLVGYYIVAVVCSTICGFVSLSLPLLDIFYYLVDATTNEQRMHSVSPSLAPGAEG